MPTRTEELARPTRRWPWLAWLSLLACDARCGSPAATAESSPPIEPAARAEAEPPTPPLRQRRVTAADVQDIPHAELNMVATPDFEMHTLGKPTVLMEGRFLRLPYEPWPLAPNRGFVLVEDGPSYDSSVLEARLLDLETGKVLAVLRRLYRGSYAKLGVALGEAEVGGTLHEVLVHASDGQIVPLWTAEQGKSRFTVINAGTGEAWVFERGAWLQAQHEKKLERKAEERRHLAQFGSGAFLYEDEEPEEPEPKEPLYRYAFWPDLRKPPPEPTEPFWHEINHGRRTPPGGWLGPTERDPAEAPLFLPTSSDDECPKVEMKRDGYRCASWDTWAMADGWRGRFDEALDTTVMSNAAREEEQVVDLGGGCRIDEVTLDPPRAVLLCDDSPDRILWSPDKVVRVPEDLIIGQSHWSRTRRTWELTRISHPESLPIEKIWIDTAEFRSFRYHAVANLTPYAMGQHFLFDDRSKPAELYVADLRHGRAYQVPLDSRGCNDYSTLATVYPISIYICLDTKEAKKRMGVIDIERHILWKSPILREAWVLPDAQAIIGFMRSGSRQRIVRWDLH